MRTLLSAHAIAASEERFISSRVSEILRRNPALTRAEVEGQFRKRRARKLSEELKVAARRGQDTEPIRRFVAYYEQAGAGARS